MKFLIRLIGLIVWLLWVICRIFFSTIANFFLFLWHFDVKHCYFPIKSSDYYFYLSRKERDFEFYPDSDKIYWYDYDAFYQTPIDMLLNKVTRREYNKDR